MEQSFKELCRKVRCEATYGNNVDTAGDDWRQTANPWMVRLKYRGRQLTVPFWTGSAITADPDAEGVLDCLISDATAYDNARDFEDFCAEFGYDTDSRRAERTYRECGALSARVHKFLGDDFEAFALAER